MQKVFSVGTFSKAIVSKANCCLNGKQAYKVLLLSHDDTDDIKVESLVAANNYKNAADIAFERYLNS